MYNKKRISVSVISYNLVLFNTREFLFVKTFFLLKKSNNEHLKNLNLFTHI